MDSLYSLCSFHGKDGHGGSSNPFLVVLNYFAIWAAIIIPTYYLEQRKFRKKGNQPSFILNFMHLMVEEAFKVDGLF